MSALVALLSSCLWGLSDFLGGTASRRLPVPTVLGLSQLTALLLLAPVAVGTGALGVRRSYLGPAVLAGAIGMVALAMFFRALSIGTMGVVAPVAALGVAVPVLVGLIRGESPTGWQLAGIGVAVAGAVLAGGPELSSDRPGRGPALMLAAGAAAGFGMALLLVAKASTGSPGEVVMTLLTMRLTSVTVLSLLLVAFSTRRGWQLSVHRADLPLLATIGVADASANGLYALAVRSSLLSVAAVLASLYPVVTVLLAYWVHGERLSRLQVAGVSASLAGVLLIAGG